MTKLADPMAKTVNLVLVSKDEWEEELRAFKEICARNDLKISDELYHRGVKSFLRDHHWPPGNSQVQIIHYVEGSKVQQPLGVKCGKIGGALKEGRVYCRLGSPMWVPGVTCYSCKHNELRKK